MLHYIYNGSKYYNGTGFGSASIAWLDATLSGSAWNYTSPTWVETATYNVTVRSNDILANTGTSVTRQFIADSTAPTVARVNSTKADGSYKAGDIINITVTFSEIVNVVDTPLLELELGDTDKNISYSAGTGSTVLIFSYTVASPDTSSDLDFRGNYSLYLNSGTINDRAGIPATLTLAEPGANNSLGANKDLVIDTTAPVVNMINSSFSTTDLTPGITFNFSDVVSTANCSLYFNDTSAMSNATVNADTNTIITAATQTTDTNYTVYVNCTDTASNVGQSSVINVILDTTDPTVTRVNSTKADGSYNAGDIINITVTFDEIVAVIGAPVIELELGDTDRNATYLTGNGTTILVFNYTVQAGDTSSDLDYTRTDSLDAGTSIKDGVGNDAVLTLATPGANNSLGANKDLVIDTTASAVTRVNSTKADGSYKAGVKINITVTFNETMTVTGTPLLELELGDTDRNATYLTGNGTTILVFNYTVQAGDTSSDLDYTRTDSLDAGTSIKDGVGNDAVLTLATPGANNSLGANKDLVIDTTAPTFSEYVRSTTSNVKSGDTIYIAFNVSETLSANPTVTVGGEAMTNITATGYDYNFSRVLNGSEFEGIANISITGLDIASNEGTEAETNFTTDFTKPTVSSLSYNDTEPFNNGTIIISVNMSEAVSTVPKIAIDAPGTGADVTATDMTNTGNSIDFTYNYTFNSTDGTSNITINTAADAAGNVMTADTTYSFTTDTTPSSLSPVSIASNNTNTTLAKVGDRITITFTANENISTPVVTIDGNAADDVTNTTGTTVWAAYRHMQTGDTEGNVGFTIDYNDSVGNAGTQVTATTDSSNVTFDETKPAPAITGVSGSWVISDLISIACTDAGTDCVSTIWYYFDSDGTCASIKATFTSNTTDANITVDTDNNNYLCIWVEDNAGNTNTTVSSQIMVDTAAPTVGNMNASTTNSTYTISGTANGTGSSVVNITFDNSSLTINSSEIVNFSVQKNLSVGDNLYNITIIDAAGNQYNSTVKITRTQSSTTGSSTSSGGTPSASFWTSTYIVNDDDFVVGYCKSLAQKKRLKVTIDHETHYIGIVNLSDTQATINVSSETQQEVFNIGDIHKFEVTNDTYYDIEVKLNAILDNKANITVTFIHEEVIVEDDVDIDTQEDQTITDSDNIINLSNESDDSIKDDTTISEEKTTNKKINIYILILIIILAVGCILILLRSGKKERR